MKIKMSSAEFTLNNQIGSTIFPSGGFTRELNDSDLNKIKAWEDYKKEISDTYPISKACGCAWLKKDSFGNQWVHLGGSGFCDLYSIGGIEE